MKSTMTNSDDDGSPAAAKNTKPSGYIMGKYVERDSGTGN